MACIYIFDNPFCKVQTDICDKMGCNRIMDCMFNNHVTRMCQVKTNKQNHFDPFPLCLVTCNFLKSFLMINVKQ